MKRMLPLLTALQRAQLAAVDATESPDKLQP